MKNLFEFNEFNGDPFKGYGDKVKSFEIGTDFYFTPSTKGDTRYYKIISIKDGKVEAQDYDFVLNGKDITRGKKSIFTIPSFAYDVNQNKISKYERGDL